MLSRTTGRQHTRARMASTSLALAVRALCLRAGLETPTARPDLSERACFLTVPFQATVKFLSGVRPIYAHGLSRGRHDVARRLPRLASKA